MEKKYPRLKIKRTELCGCLACAKRELRWIVYLLFSESFTTTVMLRSRTFESAIEYAVAVIDQANFGDEVPKQKLRKTRKVYTETII